MIGALPGSVHSGVCGAISGEIGAMKRNTLRKKENGMVEDAAFFSGIQ